MGCVEKKVVNCSPGLPRACLKCYHILSLYILTLSVCAYLPDIIFQDSIYLLVKLWNCPSLATCFIVNTKCNISMPFYMISHSLRLPPHSSVCSHSMHLAMKWLYHWCIAAICLKTHRESPIFFKTHRRKEAEDCCRTHTSLCDLKLCWAPELIN